jgi:hypothetical protein
MIVQTRRNSGMLIDHIKNWEAQLLIKEKLCEVRLSKPDKLQDTD